jgi:hypothetical protein
MYERDFEMMDVHQHVCSQMLSQPGRLALHQSKEQGASQPQV